MKYKVRNFTISYTRHTAKEKRKQRVNLENQQKILEKSLNEDYNLNKCNSTKNEFDAIYGHITEGMRIRSKYDWREHGQKLTKFFMNLEKQRRAQNTIKNLFLKIKKLQTRHKF